MIRMGLVYGNLMSNLQPNNEKLVRRACEILAEEAGIHLQGGHAGDQVRLERGRHVGPVRLGREIGCAIRGGPEDANPGAAAA